jgi:EAL domain-containing protein (putative c-di-GMP-specific phosphodiesterase class I)
MPGGGLAAAQLIGSLSPTTRIVIFSADADEPLVLPLLQSGIDGFVVKGAPPDRLADAIRSAVAGDKFLAPEVGKVALDALTTRLHAEQQVALQRERGRDRIADVIAETRFIEVLQPIVDVRTSVTVGVEALTRFTALPARTPDVWFADADTVGMRNQLELATASLALAELARLRGDLTMSVNVSPAVALSGRLQEILLEKPLDRIILELTEHTAVEDYPALLAALSPWRKRGARLAVDDAGGGYASFAHVLNLHPDYIKLDVNLTRDIHIDMSRSALARALVGYASELGIDVIAEGIETAAELDAIVALGVPYAQGFHLGRPKPLDEQPELLGDTDLRPHRSSDVDLRHDVGATSQPRPSAT